MRTVLSATSLGLHLRLAATGILSLVLAGACSAHDGDALGRASLAQTNTTSTSCTSDTDMDGHWQDLCVLHGGQRTECTDGVAYCCRKCTEKEGCDERCSQNPDDLDRSATTPPFDIPPDKLTIDQFAETCVFSGGGLASKDEKSACCTVCTDSKNCLDICTDTEALSSLKELSPDEDAKLDELIAEVDPGYSERQSGTDVDTYNMCLSVCKWGYSVCNSAPVPVPHDDQFSFCTKGLWWGCIGACFDVWHSE